MTVPAPAVRLLHVITHNGRILLRVVATFAPALTPAKSTKAAKAAAAFKDIARWPAHATVKGQSPSIVQQVAPALPTTTEQQAEALSQVQVLTPAVHRAIITEPAVIRAETVLRAVTQPTMAAMTVVVTLAINSPQRLVW